MLADNDDHDPLFFSVLHIVYDMTSFDVSFSVHLVKSSRCCACLPPLLLPLPFPVVIWYSSPFIVVVIIVIIIKSCIT